MEAIQYYVKGAFQGVAETPEVLEQQEELIADLTAKVADLVADGKSEDEALGVAIASVGDLSGLVAEFAPAAAPAAGAMPVPVPTANVQAARLDFHVLLVALGLDAAFMIFCTVLGALTGTIDQGAGFVLMLLLVSAGWWIRMAYVKYQADPATVETRELVYRPRMEKALGLWAAVCFAALVMNTVSGTDFWFWPIWVGATVMPIRVLVERWMTTRGMFASKAVAPEGVAAAVAAE